jgi:MFS transporter, PAT family, beta-lactamase induction signal transducer AmpG
MNASEKTTETSRTLSWLEALKVYKEAATLRMLALGFSAGLPLLLVLGTLSYRLREAGIDRATIGFLTWVGLAYGFKWCWAPLVDRLPIPLLTRWLGQRRSWLLLAQLFIIAGLVGMAVSDPKLSLMPVVWCALLVAFASATQDIALDAFRIESADVDRQAALAAAYQTGYRLAMIWAGAGVLWIAARAEVATVANYDPLAWRTAYLCMAASMLVGIVTVLLCKEPSKSDGTRENSSLARVLISEYSEQGVPLHFCFATGLIAFLLIAAVLSFPVSWFLGVQILPHWPILMLVAPWNWGIFVSSSGRFFPEILFLLNHLIVLVLLSSLSVVIVFWLLKNANRRIKLPTFILPFFVWIQTAFVLPFAEFFERYKWQAVLILALIAVYRISDIVMGVMANPFYVDMGFTKDQVAGVTKVYGVIMTLVGAFIGGILSMRLGVMRVLVLGAVLSAVSNLLFAWLGGLGPNLTALIWVISADNLASGIASAAFIAYLSSLTNIQYSATQYALFSSLMLLLPKFLAGFSGQVVNAVGYVQFFTGTALLGLPVVVLVLVASRVTQVKKP